MKKNYFNKRNKSLLILFLQLVFSVGITKAQCTANFSFVQGINGNVVFTDVSTGTLVGTVFSWNFGEPLSGYNYGNGQSPNHIYGSNGMYSVTLTIVSGGTAGCVSSISQNVTVTTSPCNLPIDASWTYTIGVGSVTFNSTSTGTTGGASYTWDFGDGGTANTANAIHVYTNNTNYNPKLKIIDGGCIDSLASPIMICLIVPSFTTVSGPNGSYGFTSTSTGTPGGTTYNWLFGDGNNGPGPITSHTYNSNGNYNITLWMNNINFTTCPTNTAQAIISVGNATCNLYAGFSYTVNPGGVVNFESTSTGTFPGSTYLWNYGDGAVGTGSSSAHTYLNGGDHDVWLKVNNSITCFDSILIVVNVSSIPCIANSNFSLTFSGTPLLWYATPSYPWNLTCANWNWGDGSTNTLCAVYASHTYSAAGIYTICLNATAGCGTSTTCSANSIFKSANANETSAMITLSVVPIQQFITALKKNAEENAHVTIYPNPNNGKINIIVDNIKSGTKDAIVEVYDVLGKIVYNANFETVNGSVNTILDIENSENGLYTVKIKTSEKTYLLKTTISK